MGYVAITGTRNRGTSLGAGDSGELVGERIVDSPALGPLRGMVGRREHRPGRSEVRGSGGYMACPPWIG